MRPTIIVIAGAASNVGKTTLICELLQAFPGWEAVKLTRGHSRSCGRAPEACCVSPLLRDEPLILSAERETRVDGKDTGKYWAAGAANVHWVIATDDQVEAGIGAALERVNSPGVIIEGTSVLRYVRADQAILVARSVPSSLKPSARRALRDGMIDVLYLSSPDASPAAGDDALDSLPLYTPSSLNEMIARLRDVHLASQEHK